MPPTQLIPISCTAGEIRLQVYADTLAYDEDGTAALMHFGGYPEQVSAMCEAVRGGSVFTAELNGTHIQLKSEAKRYEKQISQNGAYAEATLRIQDDAARQMDKVLESKRKNGAKDLIYPDAPEENSESLDSYEESEQMVLQNPGRNVYIFCKVGDKDRHFDEIDQKTGVPLISDFRDYFIEKIMEKGYLRKLHTYSITLPMEAWVLTCTEDDANLMEAAAEGIRIGALRIPGATDENSQAFTCIQTIPQYLKTFGTAIAERLKTQYKPLFDPGVEPLSRSVEAISDNVFRHTGYHLYDAQLAVAEATKRAILKGEAGIIDAECGAGKCKIGLAAMYGSYLEQGRSRIFMVVMGPAHMTEKWRREIEETIPNAVAGIVQGVNGMKKLYHSYEKDNRPYFAVISKETARDGYMRYPAIQYGMRYHEKAHKLIHTLNCSHCGKPIEVDSFDDGVKYKKIAGPEDFRSETALNHKCEHCGTVFWAPYTPMRNTMLTPDGGRAQSWIKISGYGYAYRRQVQSTAPQPSGAKTHVPLSSYIKKKMKGRIDGLIADELQDYAQNSGQGDAMYEIKRVSRRFIGMTGSLINGYASGIFYLLYRTVPDLMQLDGKNHTDKRDFCKEYGVLESTYHMTIDYSAKRRFTKSGERERELPGVSPLIYTRFLLEHAAFLSLADIGAALPEYEEFPIGLNMREDVKSEYVRIKDVLVDYMRSDRRVAKKLQGAYLHLLTGFPDQPYAHEPILYPGSDKIILVPRDVSSCEELHEKDKRLLDIVEQKLTQGGNVLIYTTWIRLDTQRKLDGLLKKHGWNSAILPASVKPAQREAWVGKAVQSGVRLLICNPEIVKTGLDLNEFTTLIFYNMGYKLFTLRQAARRSWRINQKAPRIEVYFFYYRETIQERALQLMASKLSAASIIEGAITDEGLAAMSDCQDISSQLAKELIYGIKGEVEDMSSVFKRMAFLKHQGTDDRQTTGISQEAAVPAQFAPAATTDIPIIGEEQTSFIFAAGKVRKNEAAVVFTEQLSLFGVPA